VCCPGWSRRPVPSFVVDERDSVANTLRSAPPSSSLLTPPTSLLQPWHLPSVSQARPQSSPVPASKSQPCPLRETQLTLVEAVSVSSLPSSSRARVPTSSAPISTLLLRPGLSSSSPRSREELPGPLRSSRTWDPRLPSRPWSPRRSRRLVGSMSCCESRRVRCL
jgi:hypothetical protein